MYKNFECKYSRDLSQKIEASNKVISHNNDRSIYGWDELFLRFSGTSFNSGIYRIFDLEDVKEWSERLVEVFPSYENQVLPFAFDWLNRIYCIDFQRVENTQPLILLFSHLTDDILEIPANLIDFHNEILVESGEVVLESELFKEILRLNSTNQLNFSDCIEMKIPLFLGGQYLSNNMGIQDRVVDWDINAQLLAKVRSLDDGISIDKVTLRP